MRFRGEPFSASAFRASSKALCSPIFNPGAADYQNFALPASDEPNLVAKICQYIGIEIREEMVYQFGGQEETLDTQETS